jgi:hypothetical protein
MSIEKKSQTDLSVVGHLLQLQFLERPFPLTKRPFDVVGHLGVSNAFLINTKHELAVKYNSVAVQENMHADSTLRLIDKHQFLLKHNDPQRFFFFFAFVLAVGVLFQKALTP